MLPPPWDPGLARPAAAQTSPTTRERDKRGPVLRHPWSRPRKAERDSQRQVSGQKSCFFGVETYPELIWDNWDVGKEFTKTLVLKNTLSKQQKLLARPPVTEFFTTSFPQAIILRPGMTYSLLICFKPLQRREYEDTIEFQSKHGSFQVCIRATIHLTLQVPDFVELPICAVQHTSSATFKLKNFSILQVCFQWDCSEPFQLIPERGRLKAGDECIITVIFKPAGAQLYQQKASCRSGDGQKYELEKYCTVLLQGQAKYPYLQLRVLDSSEEEKPNRFPELCFGSVAPGCTVQKHFDIYNPSPVAASFALLRMSGGVPLFGSEFKCNSTRGTVGPHELLQATVSYTPAVVESVSVEYLSLQCPGALNKSQLKLIGHCIGPTLSLFPSVVDFGCIEEGEAAMQTVDLVNSSPAEAVFQWDLDCNGHSVFRIQPAAGTVRPHSYVKLKAFYRPTHPITHHRRVPCLVLHKDPLFLDLIGTCCTELEDPGEKLSKQGALWPQEESSQDGVSTPMDEYFRACPASKEDSCFPASLSPRVSVQPMKLLFNHRKSAPSISSQAVSITNHTRKNLSMVWTAATDSPFSVSPSSCNLGPLKSTSFRVNYAPGQSHSIHGAQLECFSYSKGHYQKKEQPSPPCYVTVRVIGHSFQPGKEPFIPRCGIQHPYVVFPALNVPSYRTVLLRNGGDRPLTFESPNPSMAGSVFVLPSCGLVPPGDYQIVLLRTTPTDDSPKQGFSLHLKLNASEHTQALEVVSTVEKPCICMERDGPLYFQPTALCSRTQRLRHIRNLSPFPLRFEWRIQEQDKALIYVEPAAGEMHPNEISMQTWSFSPLEETMYKRKVTLIFWPVKTPRLRSQLTLDVVGMGSKGSIESEMPVLDVGDIVIGTHRSIAVPLVNKSLCAVSFCLSVQQTLQDEDSSYDPQDEPSAPQLKRERGTIPSHSKLLLQTTVRPHRRAQYQWTISCQTLNANGVLSCPPQALCEVLCKGVLPTLHVVDACSGGSVSGLSKTRLWNLLSLDGFNQHLLSSTTELSSRNSTGQSPDYSTLVTQTVLDFDFSISPLHSDPSMYVLVFSNPGSISVEWTFLFPEDQIEEFVFIERGVLDNTSASPKKNPDKQVFSIFPRSGVLFPGQQTAVHLSYSHDFAGPDRLPVLFKLSHGREIWLIFQGLTVEKDKPYLHFASSQHVFTSVNIGNLCPPRQMYELYNGGAVPVCYEVDTAPLMQLQLDSANHPVLHCLNPLGEVLPGKTAMIEFVFSPLEARHYHVDVPIQIHGGDSVVVTFEGHGLNSLPLNPSDSFDLKDAKPSAYSVKRAPNLEQVAFLSENTVSLGDIPVCYYPTRIIFLTNLSQKDAVVYDWGLPHNENLQVVQIHPERGRLGPEESALCVLTFTPSDYPTIYQLDLICQVCQEDELIQYQQALQRLEEAERQSEENSTDNDHASYALKGTLIRKYKALPPICASQKCEATGSTCSRMRKLALKEQEGSPKPTLLHLGVTARSHELMDYLTHYPHQLNKQCVYRGLQSFKFQRPAVASTGRPGPAIRDLLRRGFVRDVVLQILTPLLRNCLDDPTFSSLMNVPTEPMYFSQILSTASAHPPSLSSLSPAPPCPTFLSPTPPLPQHQDLLSGTDAWLKEECIREGSGETGSRNTAFIQHRTQNTKQTHNLRAAHTLSQLRAGNPDNNGRLADLCVHVLLNTLQNLMKEVFQGELDLTAHPRAIMLPPASTSRRHKHTQSTHTE
ncbi:cilia- and flagella-associated protein 65 [Genypterus blacodes]|uniref:cilia- and flagella-associated protein 65 n=1 Tax=Genypterus blacodes TaxID=154954 RepID=UPI003F75C30D